MLDLAAASLRSRLYLLILVIFIPGWVLIFYAAEEQRRSEKDAILDKAMMIARAAAGEEDQQVRAARGLLSAVADLIGGTQCSAEQLGTLLNSLLRRSPEYAQIGVLAPDGHVSVSAPEMDPSANFSTRNWFEQAIKTKAFAAGQYKAEQVAGQAVLFFAMPVADGRNDVTAVAFAAIDLNWMSQGIFKFLEELPKGSTLAQVDADGNMLTLDPAVKKWTLQAAAPPPLLDLLSRRPSGIDSFRQHDGTSWLYAFASVSSSVAGRRAYVVLELPRQIAFAGSQRAFWRSIVLMGLFAVLAAVLSWRASDFLVLRPVRAMVRASRQIAAGDLDARVGSTGSRNELGDLARVFDDMAEAVKLRESRERATREELKRSREQLRNLASYLQDAREKERIRIAREIHDDFGQSLTILKMDLSWLNSHMEKREHPVQEKISAMAQVIDKALHILHSVSAELRPVILDDFGLAAAIEWQAAEFQSRTGIQCNVEAELPAEELPKPMVIALFRIFQEALTNIIRHAAASRVTVRLAGLGRQLVLEVVDNGRGITEAETNAPQAFGLIGMRERLYPWNGLVEIAGRPGQGTRVRVVVPLTDKGDTL
jgi:signal transduction histidine kinase